MRRMGLVSTWLNGIGLSSAVPTFHAAGITTPSALAELDVNHFEALGITDANDRRKLFYLVQRIKMAVNKEKPTKQGDSVEEKVDALIINALSTEADDPAVSETGIINKNNIEDTPKRRSKRIAKKKDEDGSKKSKESSSKSPTKDKKKKTKDPSSAKKKKKSKSKKEEDVTSGENLLDDNNNNKEDPAQPPKIHRASSTKKNAVFNVDDSREPQNSVLVTPTKTTRAQVSSSLMQSPERKTKRDEKRPTKIASPKSSKLASPATSRQAQSGLPQPKAGILPGSNLPAPSSRLQPPKSRRPESKLQNPGTSIRTGKQLSAIPSESEAQMSPLKAIQVPEISEDEDQNMPSKSNDSIRGGSKIVRPARKSVSSNGRISMGGNKNNIKSADTSTRSDAPYVHGRTEAQSWESQVCDLREDNNAEHALFREQSGDEVFDYDMRIRVIVRKRPLSKSEASASGSLDVIHPLDYNEYGKVLVYQPKTRVDLTKEVETVPFAYDNVYDESSTNVQIYQRSLRNLIHPFFKGQWSTVFAYGQTGSGKTYTMMGSNMTGMNAGTAIHDTSNLGLYYLAALDIFDMVKRPEYSHLTVQVSLFEIYGGKLFDLLNGRNPVKCLEDSKGKVCFPGLTEHPVEGPDRLMQVIEEGALNRSTGTTSRNADSSRSHAVLQLKLRKNVGRKKNIEHGRLNFIDLAGSERGADTSNCSRATRLEGAEINTSLLALKEVIRALATGGSMTHIPFRGSKLTQVLKDSFVGKNSRCCMVACISPYIGNCEQTLNTLRYADRVKERDSESGALPSSCDQPVKLSSLSHEMENGDAGVVLEAGDSFDEGDDEYLEADMSVNQSYQSTDTRTLDALLATPLPERKQSSKIASSSKHKAGEELVAAHRSILSSMLAMVKNEMVLVNKVDCDRDGLDEYLSELEDIQSTHLDLITKLRGALNTYVTAAESSPRDQQLADDDSFEDLRD